MDENTETTETNETHSSVIREVVVAFAVSAASTIGMAAGLAATSLIMKKVAARHEKKASETTETPENEND